MCNLYKIWLHWKSFNFCFKYLCEIFFFVSYCESNFILFTVFPVNTVFMWQVKVNIKVNNFENFCSIKQQININFLMFCLVKLKTNEIQIQLGYSKIYHVFHCDELWDNQPNQNQS